VSYEPLDEEVIEARAHAAGLERAWMQCREDVLAAAREAARLGAALPVLDPTAEPWPPMRVPSGSDE
jgi:hypothetical protein